MTDNQHRNRTPSTSQTAEHCESPPQGAVFRAASAYHNCGLSVIPIEPDGTKSPAIGSWKTYQKRLPTNDELHDWFQPDRSIAAWGLAVIGGAVSGGLEILDIDSWKYVDPWMQLVEKAAPGLLDRLVLVQTPRPGLHVYFRSTASTGNQKLARVPVIDKKTGERKPKAIIETRGERGYALAPPSPPECHPTGRCYEVLYGKDLTMIPTISPDERAVLFDAARAFNRWKDPRECPEFHHRFHHTAAPQDGRPGDEFNARGDWREILEPHGWTLLFIGSDGTEYWRRPGKNAGGSSATVNHGGFDLLYVFSSNAAPFESERAFTKFSAYALLNHGGDFEAAARDLAAQGFGHPRRHRHRRKHRRCPSAFARYSEYFPPPGWRR